MRPRRLLSARLLSNLVLLAVASSNASAQDLKPGRKYTSVERLQPERLAAVRAARDALARDRKPPPEVGVYQDFRAVLHVHAEDAKHTLGTREQVHRAAREAGVRIVMFSDHDGPTSATWHGLRDGILYFKGAENGSRHELAYALPAPGLRFHSHVETELDASADGWDGMEIYNRHTDAEDDTDLLQWLRAAAKDPAQIRAIAGLAAKYPDELFGAGVDYWPAIFARWDRVLETRRFPGIAANDAHQNNVLSAAGVTVTLDPYAVAFRNVSTHILARELTPDAVAASLRAGRAYVSHDWLADPSGFTFGAVNSLGVYQMGDGVPLAPGTRLMIRTPVPAILRIIHNGKVVAEKGAASELAAPASGPGAYRAEAWLDIDGEQRPWIYANPVYAETPAPAAAQLPSQQLSDSVEAVKDIPYVEAPVEEAKQKLDIYRPKGASARPVLVFFHGGAWVRGDRGQYPFFGNRFAKAGYVVVIPSYRLAPKNPHPAQIEDAAAALAWTVTHVAEYGGDPSRITIAGHSAGGHLASLLVTNEEWLTARGISSRNVRAVAALSAPVDLAPLINPGRSPIFGSDPAIIRAASPLRNVRAGLPRFLVTYCQWDYATLPQQAEAFHAALTKAGGDSQLVYIPGENHISEMTSIPKDSDPTAIALLQLLKQVETR